MIVATFLFALVACSFAVPLNSGSLPPKCSTECSVTPLQSLLLKPQTTYTYKYRGESSVTLVGVQDGKSTLRWDADVELSAIHRCDVAVQIKSIKFEGGENTESFEKEVTEYPLTAAMSQGVVTTVCAHPKDSPHSLNFKKAILSQVQNTLTSFSKIQSGKTFIETDISGRCPTQYDVEFESQDVVKVQKVKEHKNCEQRYGSVAENPLQSVLLKTPLPLQQSNSTCTQKIQDGIVKSTKCRDVNVVKPVIGSYKFIKAVQESILELQQSGRLAPINPMQSIRYTNLTYEYIPVSKIEKAIPQVEQLLKELCQKTEKSIQKESAKVLSEAIGLLSRVPEDQVESILSKIRSKSLCSQSKKLESLFLDAIPFVQNNAGAVKIMVDEVLNRPSRAGRDLIYTVAMHLNLRKPCLKTIHNLKRLIESEKAPTTMKLAAGSVVRKYCEEHPHCMQEQEIKEIMQVLTRQIQDSYPSSSGSQVKKNQALVALKTVGNMANMSRPLESALLEAVQSQQASIQIRVAAAQSFRLSNCSAKVTQVMVRQSLKQEEKTEVRIASYRAAIRCANATQAREIVQVLESESSSQVKSYVFSHMRNLQATTAPSLQAQKRSVSALVIPVTDEYDPRKYSRNVDLSWNPTEYLGAGISGDVIYAPDSNSIQLDTALNLNIDQSVRPFEFGARLENWEKIFEIFFGPNGYFQRTPINQIIKDMSQLLKEKSSKIKSQFEEGQGSGQGLKSLSKIMSSLFSSSSNSEGQQQKLDIFARILGSEVGEISITRPTAKQLDQFIEELTSDFMKPLVSMSTANDVARALQVNQRWDVPTAQGIPLKFEIIATAIVGLDSKLQAENFLKSKIELNSGLSVDVRSSAVYDFGAETGLRHRATAHSNIHAMVELEMGDKKLVTKFDLQKKSKVIDIESDLYMMTKMPEQADKKISKAQYPMMKVSGCCKRTKQSFGLDVCGSAEIPDFIKSQELPLGEAKLLLSIGKPEPSKQVAITTASWNEESGYKSVRVQLDAPQASVSRKGSLEVAYKKTSQIRSMQMLLEVPEQSIRRAVKIDLETASSQSVKKAELHIYSARKLSFSPSDKVIEAVVRGAYEQNEVSGKLVLKTSQPLSKYIDVQVDVDIASELNPAMYHLPRNIKVRKLEADLAILEQYKSVNHIRRTSSVDAAQYKIKSATTTPSMDLLIVDGQAKVKGHLETKDLESSINLTVKVAEKSLEAGAELVHKQGEHLVSVHLNKQSERSNKKILLAEVQLKKMSQSSRSYEVKAAIEAPAMISSYSASGSAQQRSSETYELSLDAKRNGQVISKIQGPVTYKRSEGRYEQESHITIKSIQSGKKMELFSKYDLSQESKQVSLVVKQEEKISFEAKAELSHQGDRKYSSNVFLQLPKVLRGALKIEKSPRKLDLSLNAEVKPETQQTKGVKVSAIIDTERQEITTDAKLYSKQNQPQFVSMKTSYDFSIQKRHAMLRGDLTHKGRTYKYNTEVRLDMLKGQQEQQQEQQHNEISIRVVKPNQQAFEVKVKSIVRKQSEQRRDVLFESRVRTYSGKLYEISSKNALVASRSPILLKLEGQTTLETPTIKKITIKLDNIIAPSQGKIQIIAHATGPSIQKPVRIELRAQYPSSSLEYTALLDMGSVADLKLKAQARVSLRSEEPRQLELSAQMKLPQTQEYKLKIESSPSKMIEASITKGQQEVISIESSRIQKGQWTAEIRTQSQSMRAQSRMSSHDMSISLVPNTRDVNNRYEARAHFRQGSSTSGGSFYERAISVRYPGRLSDIKIAATLNLEKKSSQGSIELDIFKDPQQKMTINLSTTRLQTNTTEIVAELIMPSLDMKPKLIAGLTVTPHVKRIDATIMGKVSEPAPFNISFAIIKTSDRNSNLYALVQTPKDKFEATATLQPQNSYRCLGKSLNGTLKATKVGQFDFAAAFCSPLYIELGLKKSSEPKMFMAKVGMRPTEIKLAIAEVYNTSLPYIANEKIFNTQSLYGRTVRVSEKPVIMLGAQLSSPWSIAVIAEINATKAREMVREEMKPTYRRVMSEVQEAAQRIPRELSQKIFEGHSMELNPELQAIKEDLVRGVKSAIRIVKQALPSEQQLLKLAKKFERTIEHAEEKYLQVMKRAEEIIEEGTGFNVRQLARKVMTLEQTALKKMRMVIEELEELYGIVSQQGVMEGLKKHRMSGPVVEFMQSTSFWDFIKEKFEDMKNFYEREFAAIHGMWKRFSSAVWSDLKKMFSWSPKKVFDWFKKWLWPSQSLMVNLSEKVMETKLSKESINLRLQIPLKEASYSLRKAIKVVGLPRLVTSPLSLLRSRSHRSIWTQLMTPYAPAARIEGDQITTFDGASFPLLQSPCRILLTETPSGAKVLLRKQSSQRTEVRIVAENGKRFDFVLVEGKPIRAVPSIQQQQEYRSEEVAITVVSPQEVEIQLEGIQVVLSSEKILVEAKQWTFGKLRGLLGDNNAEKANDLPKESQMERQQQQQQRQIETAKQMLDEFKTRQSCQIPIPY